MELNTPIKYTENTTLRIEQSGTYQIEIHGASGSGGNGRIYGSYLEPDETDYYSGGSGGGGGYACSKVEMNVDDTIVLTIGDVGATTSASINSSIENYDTLSVTSGTDGKDGKATGKAAAGTGGIVTSQGNHANANGFDGTAGSERRPEGDASLAYPTPGGAPGHPDGNKGGNGGSAYKSGTVAQESKGESGLPGFIIVTLLSTDDDSGSDEGETPTDPETPPSGEDPETPSQPSTTIPDILTASSIQKLKERVNQELTRRKYYGNISSAAPSYNTPNNNVVAQASEINNNIINKLNLINNKLTQENINDPIEYSYINNQLTTFEGYSNNNTGCRQACTGFCSTACADMCVGCGETAKGGTSSSNGTAPCSECSNACTGACSGSGSGCNSCGTGCSGCEVTCSTACSKSCGLSCGGTCTSSCSGTARAGQQGSTSCSDCTGICSSGCTGTCAKSNSCSTCGQACALGCYGDCSGDCSNGCGGGCSGSCGSSSSSSAGTTSCSDAACSGECSGSCDTECTGCSSYCQGTCKNDCASSCTNFCSATSK